jgi:hypothetical protein
MNAMLLLVLLGGLTWVICIRLSPKEMRRLADYLNSRADAEDYWRARFITYKNQRELNNG